jgi:5-methylcytosine-specific restriction endonuclease McrA
MKSPNSKQRRQFIRTLWPEQDGKCFYCDRELINPDEFDLQGYFESITTKKKSKPPENYPTLDHFIPKCYGGDYSTHNLVISCFPCNHRKGDGIIPMELLDNREKLRKLFKSGEIKFHLVRSI